jgi:protein-arginine kinase
VGTLKYARRIGKEEALYLTGLIRMGINADMIPDEDGLLFYRLYSLIPDSQVAEITHSADGGEEDMEMWRSALLRDALKGL